MRTITIAVAIAAALTVTTQSSHAQVGGGLNLSRFVGGDATNDAATKLHLGASIPLLRVGPLSIVPEIYYAMRGGDRHLNAVIDNYVNPFAAFNMNYIEVPILMRLRVSMPGPFASYIGGGPMFAWQLDCGFSLSNLGEDAGEERNCRETQFSSAATVLASADRGAIGNAGLSLLMGKLGVLTLDLRVVRGLARVVEDQAGPDVRNQAVSLTLGYSLLDNGLVHIK